MDHLLLLILGIFLSTLGTVNIKGNISTIHSYNRRKVKEEDVPKYGKAVGTGTLVIGVSLPDPRDSRRAQDSGISCGMVSG